MDYESFLKRNSIVFLSFSGVLFVINVFAFILWIPRGYLSAYLLFPLNLLHTALRFNWETIVALLIGSSGMGAIFFGIFFICGKTKSDFKGRRTEENNRIKSLQRPRKKINLKSRNASQMNKKKRMKKQ
jgi:hypothetical protein